MRIGVDLDNTIIEYDYAFAAVAARLGMVRPEQFQTKSEIRSWLRSAGAEADWQRLQGQVYGRFISLAKPARGVREFLDACRRRNLYVVVVSHKTELGHFDEARVNLRDAARTWLDDNCLAPALAGVFFEATRAAKIERIRRLDLTHFIDDLPELLSDPAFPGGIERLLYAPEGDGQPRPYRSFAQWDQIARALLDG